METWGYYCLDCRSHSRRRWWSDPERARTVYLESFDKLDGLSRGERTPLGSLDFEATLWLAQHQGHTVFVDSGGAAVRLELPPWEAPTVQLDDEETGAVLRQAALKAAEENGSAG